MLTGNAFAFFILVIWPVVAWIFFTRMDPARALIWTILGGYMLLPPAIGIDLPMVPSFDKYSIPSLAAAFAVVFSLKNRFSLWPASTLIRWLILLYIVSPFATVITNGEPLYLGHTTIQATRIYDALAGVVAQLITLLPFFLARKYLSGPDGMRALVLALVVAGLIYSVPIMIESRLSPQLNVWLYGYFQRAMTESGVWGV